VFSVEPEGRAGVRRWAFGLVGPWLDFKERGGVGFIVRLFWLERLWVLVH
jgi:hypothetical protein